MTGTTSTGTGDLRITELATLPRKTRGEEAVVVLAYHNHVYVVFFGVVDDGLTDFKFVLHRLDDGGVRQPGELFPPFSSDGFWQWS